MTSISSGGAGAGAANNLGGDGMQPSNRRRHRYGETGKAGWYFWYPFLMGVLFLVLAVPMLTGAAVIPTAADGLGIAGGGFLLFGAGFVFWAFWARRDIRQVAPEAPLPGTVSEQTVRELETTGIPARGTVTGFKYVAGSSEAGTTLVELALDVTTGRGETVSMVHRSRMPLKLHDRLAVGATVPVRVSPTDAKQILVEWDGLVPAG